MYVLRCRWSRIARKLPGRTDNEIKNYWRTHMRKTAQEKKRAIATSQSSSLSNSSSSSSATTPQVDSIPDTETKDISFYDTGGVEKNCTDQEEGENGNYSMDEIWNDIVSSDDDVVKPVCDGYGEEVCNFSCPILASPVWDYSPDSLWMMEEEESKMFLPISDIFSAPFDC